MSASMLATSIFPLSLNTCAESPDELSSEDKVKIARDMVDLFLSESDSSLANYLSNVNAMLEKINAWKEYIEHSIENQQNENNGFVEITDDNVKNEIIEAAKGTLTDDQYKLLTEESGKYHLYYVNANAVNMRDELSFALKEIDNPSECALTFKVALYTLDLLDNVFTAVNTQNAALDEINKGMAYDGYWDYTDDVINAGDEIKKNPYGILNARAGNDTYVIDPKVGMVMIRDQCPNNSGNDSILFNYDVKANQIILFRNSNDLLISDEKNGNELYVKDYFANDDTCRLESLKFNDGTSLDYDAVCSITNYVAGTKDSDVLNGYADKTKIYGLSGDDTINSYSGNDIIFAGDGNDNVNSGNGDNFLIGADGNDSLVAGAGNDVIYGGKGDDYLRGGGGNNIYIYNLGDGNDTVDESNGQWSFPCGGYDIVSLGEGILPEETAVQVSSDGFTYSLIFNKTKEKLNAPGFVISGLAEIYPIEEFRFADGTVWTLKDLKKHKAIYGTDGDDQISDISDSSDIIYCGRGNDNIRGATGDDTYIYDYGDGFDKILDATIWGSANDTLSFAAGIKPSEIYYEKVDSLYCLYVRDKTGSVTIDGIEHITFTDGTKWEISDIEKYATPIEKMTEATSTEPITTAATSTEPITTAATSLSTTETTTKANIIYGDANGDNIVDISDIVILRRYLNTSDKSIISQGCLANLDTNGDGINAQDAVAIQKYVFGITKNVKTA